MFYSIDSIYKISTNLHLQSKKIVLATGFFDLLHSEHINFLRKAKLSGDILIVAVESDARARLLKGIGRPVETQSVRCRKVSEYADYVVSLGDDFNNPAAYEELIAIIKPDIYAVSSHTSHLESKKTLTEKYGGQLVVVHDFNPEISTTKILKTQNGL